MCSCLPGDSLKQRLIWSLVSTVWWILLAEPHKTRGELITKITTKHVGRLQHLREWNTRRKRQCCVTPGWDQGFGHSRILGYKQHFKEVFYSGIPQSQAKVQNGSIPRGSLVTHPNPSKNCTVLFSLKPIYGALRQETELPHQGLCFFWNWSKQTHFSEWTLIGTHSRSSQSKQQLGHLVLKGRN